MNELNTDELDGDGLQLADTTSLPSIFHVKTTADCSEPGHKLKFALSSMTWKTKINNIYLHYLLL